ncbi:PREDICTED: zinc-finger homeodomain protein 4-like [Nicotiana attenuata]|uniref:Zinc-finger homeodomain protein 4 n=1 Tax=Nicotiana attenuata TaxID=49451 RepID=A0A314KTD2_NICAT|nr:PREDICTED: zinc-finger homeodomain protein 4-like [Nicotiana attenuata]OIT32582.1 zinc-finger homeodomain protein 4 [Nicotiana attenuata]
MEIPSQEEEMPMPMPINSTYVGGGERHGHGHIIHHDPTTVPNNTNHIIPSSVANSINGPPIEATPVSADHHVPYKKIVRYKECLKNHAAAMGGNATDGCGEFMPSGEEGTIEALICSACNCHRNFHRKEIEGEQQLLQLPPPSSCDYYNLNRGGKKVYLGHSHNHHKSLLGPEQYGTVIPSRATAPHHHQMIMSYNNMGSLPSESEEHEDINGGGVMTMAMARPLHHHNQMVKKRFRTKFTQEQKEKMFNFAEKVGWKIQKQEETVVQQFCQELGIKRRVLKVWMHNNKHNLAKKNSSITIPQNQV